MSADYRCNVCKARVGENAYNRQYAIPYGYTAVCGLCIESAQHRCGLTPSPLYQYGAFYSKGSQLDSLIKSALELMRLKNTRRAAPEKDLYSFFRSVPSGHCACNIPRHQCKYHG